MKNVFFVSLAVTVTNLHCMWSWWRSSISDFPKEKISFIWSTPWKAGSAMWRAEWRPVHTKRINIKTAHFFLRPCAAWPSVRNKTAFSVNENGAFRNGSRVNKSVKIPSRWWSVWRLKTKLYENALKSICQVIFVTVPFQNGGKAKTVWQIMQTSVDGDIFENNTKTLV